MDHATGAIRIIAGAGTSGCSGDGSLPLSAAFNRLQGVEVMRPAGRRRPEPPRIENCGWAFGSYNTHYYAV